MKCVAQWGTWGCTPMNSPSPWTVACLAVWLTAWIGRCDEPQVGTHPAEVTDPASDHASSHRPLAVFHPHDESGSVDGTCGLALSPDGRWAATRSADWRIELWDVDAGRLVSQLPDLDFRVDAMVFSQDGQYLVTAGPATSHSISLWKVSTGERLREIDEPGEILQLMADGRIQTVADHRVLRFDIPDMKEREVIPLREAHHAVPLAFSPDGDKLLLSFEVRAQSQYDLKFYDLRRHDQSVGTTLGDEPAVLAMGMGGWLAVAERKNPFIHLRMARRRNGTGLLLGHEKPVQALRITPDSLFLFSAGDGKLWAWDATSQRLLGTLPGLDPNDVELAVSADGRRIAMLGQPHHQSECRIWDTAALLQSLAEQSGTRRPYQDAAEAMDALQSERDLTGLFWCLEHRSQATAAIRSELRDVVVPWDPATIARLIEQLDDPNFAVRTRAFQLLLSRHARIRKELQAASQERMSLERRLSLDRLLRGDSLEQQLALEEWRQLVRIVYVLEYFADEDCRDLLVRLADAHPDTRIRAAAAAAQQRLRSYRPRNPT